MPRPAAAAKRSKRRAGWIALGVVGALAVAGTGIVIATDGDSWPSSWDPRARAMVDFVETNRGAPFRHPVEIDFLSEQDYRATLQPDVSDGGSRDDEAAATDAGVLRALGWIDDGVDPQAENQHLLDDGTLAYYRPGEHRVVVRGEPEGDRLPVDLRVTLVHELTHAWQDQHLDLARGFGDSERDFAFRSLVEGDAVRIENEYVASLSTSEQGDYFEASQNAGADVTTDGAPGLELVFAGPYIAGPPFVSALDARDGNHRVDEAFDAPPTSSEQAMFVAVFDAGIDPADVLAPGVPDGAEALGEPVPGGSWDLLTTLGGRIEPLDALTAARAWAGGTQQAWRSAEGQVCLGWSIGADDADGQTVLQKALEDWAAAGPAGAATVTGSGTIVTLTACDAGAATVVADRAKLEAAIAVANAHAGLVQAMAAQVDLPTADCVATRLLGEVDPALFQRDDLTRQEYEQLMATAAGFTDDCKQAVVIG